MESLEPLGDQGTLARFGDESRALSWSDAVRALQSGWVIDVVSAYATVAVFHDPTRISHAEAMARLRELPVPSPGQESRGRLHVIPCCYERQLDLGRIASHTGLSAEEVIWLHSSTEYTVYAIGFCPGFPYLGYLPSAMC